MNIHSFQNAEAVAYAAAEWLTDLVQQTLQTQDRFTIALSGGSTPKLLHQLLASSPFKEKIDWDKLHFFWGDERVVPFTDERNNAKMAFDTLLNLVPVKQAQIHIMRTDIAPDLAAKEYEKILHQYFGYIEDHAHQTTFDVVLLGMGDDGHTLSLFPGTRMVYETTKWCDSFYLDQQQMYRITLTQTVANASRNIAFLTTGAGKAPALKAVLKGAFEPEKYPAQLIKPINGALHWFIDTAAGADL